MLISHEYQFIFIKTRKTAGTSVEISLSRYLGPWDVITPISPEDELQRLPFGVTPRNYLQALHPPLTEHEASVEQVSRSLGQVSVERRFYNHCPAAEIRAVVGETIWNSYTKFSFERNPWDRVLSEFRYLRRHNPRKFGAMSLAQFIEEQHFSANYPLYTIGGRFAIDFLGQHANLTDDLHHICQQLGIPFDGWLPQAKKSTGADSFRLTPRQQAIVAEKCGYEIKLLGYELPQAA